MHLSSLWPLAAGAIKVLVTNDDGWAELNIRELYYTLKTAGYAVIISAPAVNKSGTGSRDADPSPLGQSGCEFNSCPPFSSPTGYNESEPTINYVNSFPVTSVKNGISVTSPEHWNSRPDLVVAGFNVGCNLDIATLGSGTVGAACEAVKEGVPAVAFSGCTGSQISWQDPAPNYAKVYANLSRIVTEALVEAGPPYLPPNIWLNVNFAHSTGDVCGSSDDFAFVLSRISPAIPIITMDDIVICDNDGRLPTERSVVNTPGCFASISVGHADTKQTANAAEQEVVYRRLESILSCLHDDELEKKIDL